MITENARLHRLSQALVREAFVADMTTPFRSTWNYGSDQLRDALPGRLLQSGFNFISVTVAADELDTLAALRATADVRAYFLARPDTCVLVDSVADVLRAQTEGKLAVAMHFQGTVPIGRDLSLVEAFYKLGIRHMLMAYNQKNFVGDGCHEIGGTGLSRFGRQLVGEMNRIGMFVDVAHASYQTSMDVLALSDKPVIVSHGNVWALYEHPRAYHDDQIRAVAASGGVIGLTGLSIFSGDGAASSTGYVRQIDYVAQLVGVGHVGFGFDYVYDLPSLVKHAAKHADRLPPDGGYTQTGMRQVEPEQIAEIADGLSRIGYSDDDIRAVLGANWLRLMREVWQQR